MILNIYSIFDKKAGSYGTPFFTTNHPTAIRAVARLLFDPSTTVAHNPEDFQLIHIGEFDDATAQILSTPALVVSELEEILIAQNGINLEREKRIESASVER